MSAVVWSGTAQFAVLSILASGGSLVLAGGTGLIANVRYLPMGFGLAPSLRHGPLRRFLVGTTLSDASFVIGNRGDGRFDPAAVVWASPVQYLCWLGGTAIGVFSAGTIGDPGRWGLDVIFPVFYLSLLLPEISSRHQGGNGGHQPARQPLRLPRTAALLATVITLVLVPVAPAGLPVLAAAGAALIGLWPSTGPQPGAKPS
jgi:predicted branched-subunit amino acid permease